MNDNDLNTLAGKPKTITSGFDNFSTPKGKKIHIIERGGKIKEVVDLIGGKFVKLENR